MTDDSRGDALTRLARLADSTMSVKHRFGYDKEGQPRDEYNVMICEEITGRRFMTPDYEPTLAAAIHAALDQATPPASAGTTETTVEVR